MVDDKELRLWISRLECEDSSWDSYGKLAALYTIQAHQTDQAAPQALPAAAYTAAPAMAVADQVVDSYGDSDFLRAVAGKPQAQAWAVMDELMDTLRIANERVYHSVMRRVQAL